ncbi:uncharacterized protein LAESUDRAFT_645370 [Laetiporus sulphureus 93-53]|uniref:DUF202 domain-containing protein n=1 Tax=Laetiporus sulphureus 93-53 TaxID=1314785 RepID=A0A165GCJ9_9APHY|nr:uncharacterized protein LAESUDRAFT_645370 [Laetiporus sulphureus 93-53]KZT10160.1 hypothetical protein LAESUDRAFT_645370 [Laetiporus sulphureus 93-53]
MPVHVENSGSTTRDYLMLERNLLSHVKLGMLLSLLSSSVLLKVRLTGASAGGDPHGIRIPISTIEYIAAVLALCVGIFQYYRTSYDLKTMRGFLVATKIHFTIMVLVAAVVLTTCIVLLAEESF